MNSGVESFFKYIKNKKIAFVGIGGSHIPLLKMFKKNGADVIACDKRKREFLSEEEVALEKLGIKFVLGDSYLENLDVDVIFRTPGMKFHSPELDMARERGIVVTSEMEMFFDLCPCKIVAVTGSDGKTTTTTIISEILKKTGKTVWLGGNIGNPLLQEIEKILPEDIAVVELSSFQLISMRKSPEVAVVTNLSPNHLDMHKDMSEYIDAKKNIVLHQNAFSTAVVNVDNEITKSFIKYCRGKVLCFSRKNKVQNGAYVDENGDIFFAENGKSQLVLNKSEIKIPGDHNVENYLAAICAVFSDANVSLIRDVAKKFNGVEHRIEFVRELDGVKYFNDSIASSPNRTIKGTLSLYKEKIILICGGYDKKIPFDSLGSVIMEKVKVLILLGQTAGEIENAVKAAVNYDPSKIKVIRVKDMVEAVNVAKENSCLGDVVSLSPACASFGMYKNFSERGRHFKKIVISL